MPKGLFAGASPFTQFIMLAFTMIACFLLFMFMGILLVPLILGLPLTELMNLLNGGISDQNLNLLRYIQILQGIGLFIIPAFIAACLFSEKPIQYLCLGRYLISDIRYPISDIRYPISETPKPETPKPETRNPKPETRNSKWFVATLFLMLAAMPCINLMAALNEMISFPKSLWGVEQWLKAFEEAARQTTESFLKVDSVGGMFFNIFMIAILPALGEELIFRGVLQRIFVRWTGNVHVGIIITGFLFSLMHMQFYGFFPRWLLGVMFGYLLVWSGTMWLPIFAHFINNAVAVILSYLIHKGVISESIEEFGSAGADVPVTILAAAICACLLWLMYRKRVYNFHHS